MFEHQDDENIRVPKSLSYYTYRITFDFECWFDTARLPSDIDKVHCFVTDGDTDKLVSDMMDILQAMSDTAYEKSKDAYDDVLEQLAEAQTVWDEREHAARSP